MSFRLNIQQMNSNPKDVEYKNKKLWYDCQWDNYPPII